MAEPLQKRRRLMCGPDGFDEESPSAVVKKPRISEPRFESAFGSDKPKSKPKAAPKQLGTRMDPLLASSSSTSIIVPKPRAAPKPTANYPKAHLGSSTLHSLNAPRITTRNPPSPALFLGKDPGPKLKHLIPPPLPHRASLASTSTLKPLPAPPLVEQRTSKNLKTLSTTSLAISTDLSTENGAAGAASIFLQDWAASNFDDDVGGDEVDRKIKRGFDISPQKAGARSAQHSLVRNGLAAQASQIMAHTHTTHALWNKEAARSMNSTTNKPKADIRFEIVKIIHVPHATASSTSIPGLALCVNQETKRLLPPSLPSSFPFPSSPCKDTALVLLSFNSHPNPTTSAICNPIGFAEGRELWVWKPWHIVALEAASTTSAMLNKETLKKLREDGIDEVFMCDRFAIL
ncbi:hypothetical protein C8J56DRAFT_256138 [Mycena floridula]|nr:hypothetical protein C8J56DRAFT_256138 [Mycena floridula]